MSRFFRRAGDSSSDSSESSDEEELLSQDSGDDSKPKSKTTTSDGAKKPMSRFLRSGGDSDSDSSDGSSDEDSDSDSDGDAPAAQPAKVGSRFLQGAASDDSDEESVKVVVLSARDKRVQEIENSGTAIDQKLKINDWAAVNTEFDKLARLIERQSTLSGTTREPIHPTYFQIMKTLDDAFSQEKESTNKKKMDATKARALATLKQKIKKLTKEHAAEYKAYTDDTAAYISTYEAATQPVAAPKPRKVKRTVDADEEDDEFTTVGRGGRTYNYGAGDVLKTLKEIQEARGKKGTDRADAISKLEQLHKVAASPYARIRVLLALISSRFDYNAAALTHMPLPTWASAQVEINELLMLLLEDSEHVVVEDQQLEYNELEERYPTAEEPVVHIRGSVISYVDRLDDEFTKSLQNIDPHGTDYVDRLKDEKPLYELLCRAQILFEAKEKQSIPRVLFKRLEHIYSKPVAVVSILEKSASEALSSVLPSTFTTLASLGDVTSLVRSMCVRLYQTDAALLRTRAMLFHVYHHAFINDFHTARDLFLMSHLSENIHSADVGTQILFNRAVAQLGLCAFRSGLIKEAHSTLQDIHTTQRVKELLAQGVQQQRYSVLTPEQERAERARQLPFHMHINTELLESAFLVSSMLVEIPLLASIDNEEQKRKAISRPFRRLLDFADRQVFAGPPETTRDHIMQASKALQDGEWEKCRDLIQNIKIWSLMSEEAEVKEMLTRRIQEEGLRTYLFTYSSLYASLSLSRLAQTFSLPDRAVVATVSKMIWSDELAASLDHANGTVVFHKSEVNRVQQLAQTLAEKVHNLSEQSAKTLESKLGSSGDGTRGNWGERNAGDGGKKDGGEGGQERRRGGPRTGGGRGRGSRFAQGLGGRVAVSAS